MGEPIDCVPVLIQRHQAVAPQGVLHCACWCGTGSLRTCEAMSYWHACDRHGTVVHVTVHGAVSKGSCNAAALPLLHAAMLAGNAHSIGYAVQRLAHAG